MKEKLLYAISNCESMDADFRLSDGELGGWREVDDQAEMLEREREARISINT